MWVIWSWEDVVIAELKVSGGLLIAPEFCRHLSDETKKKGLNEEAPSLYKIQLCVEAQF